LVGRAAPACSWEAAAAAERAEAARAGAAVALAEVARLQVGLEAEEAAAAGDLKEKAEALEYARRRRKAIAAAIAAHEAAQAYLADRTAEVAHARALRAAVEELQAGAARAAASAADSGSRARTMADQARGMATDAARVLSDALVQIAQRRAELAEDEAIARAQGWPGPLPGTAARDDDNLEEKCLHRLLFRPWPRAVRLFGELLHRDELWRAMGTGAAPPPHARRSPSLEEVKRLLCAAFATSSGDVAFQAEGPFRWRVALKGPRGTPYGEGVFCLDMELPGGWPTQRPEVRFRTPVHHCNVAEDGTVARGALPEWSSSSSCLSVLGAVASLLCAPVPSAAARPDLAARMAADPVAFAQEAMEATARDAAPPPAWAAEAMRAAG
ncbi:unnamed protein product, partial [Prorocentrum cordatum]